MMTTATTNQTKRGLCVGKKLPGEDFVIWTSNEGEACGGKGNTLITTNTCAPPLGKKSEKGD